MSLKDELDQFGKLFKQHLNGSQKATLRWVTAEEIDWDNKTMTALDSDDVPYYDVLLGVGMMSVKPSQNADCLVAILEGDEATAFMLYTNVADLIEYNGGVNGGLVKIEQLTAKLNDLQTSVNSLISKYNSHTHTVSTTGTAAAQSGTAAATTSQAENADEFRKDDYEDTKITH